MTPSAGLEESQPSWFAPGTSTIPALDGIRAVAALQILLLHFTTLDGIPAALRRVALLGQGGVDLFFVLSGFLITRILLFSKDSPTYFSHFYARRVLRIFPLYYAFLIVYFFVCPRLFAIPKAPFSRQIWAWLFLENVPLTFTGLATRGPNHYWSLAVEEHFYLVWPCLVLWLPRQRLRWVLAGLILAAPLVRIAMLAQGIEVNYFTLCRMDGLALGALLACLYEKSNVGSRALALVGRGLLLALPLALVPLFLKFSGSHAAWLQVLKLSFIPAFFFGLMLFCLLDPAAGLVRGFFSLPLLRWLGKISYGLYVLHPLAVMTVLRTPGVQSDLRLAFVVFLALTVLLAFASYRWLESPILRWKEKFGYERRQAGALAGGRP